VGFALVKHFEQLNLTFRINTWPQVEPNQLTMNPILIQQS